MIKIKLFGDFGDREKYKTIVENIYDASNNPFYGVDKKIFITNDDDFTHAIILNKDMPDLKIPKENVLGLACEPYEYLCVNETFVNYAQKHIGKYLIGDKHDLPEPFIEHFGYMWHSNPKKDFFYKPNIMSIVVSEKTGAPGHRYRHILAKEIVKYNLPVDIYGRGSNGYKSAQMKGTFHDVEPYETYMFSICIENFSNNHYFSEKIITPLLYNCRPIYCGCKNIRQYFNDDTITLSGVASIDIQLIIQILNNPSLYYKKTYTDKNLKTVNLLHNLDKLFD